MALAGFGLLASSHARNIWANVFFCRGGTPHPRSPLNGHEVAIRGFLPFFMFPVFPIWLLGIILGSVSV